MGENNLKSRGRKLLCSVRETVPDSLWCVGRRLQGAQAGAFVMPPAHMWLSPGSLPLLRHSWPWEIRVVPTRICASETWRRSLPLQPSDVLWESGLPVCFSE